MPNQLVVMGVSGCGKTTIAELLARRARLEYLEADRFHPPANIAKIRGGIPLTDADRWPWLQELSGWMARRHHVGVSTVLACSALKREYRDILRGQAPAQFVHLDGPVSVIRQRMQDRQDHFMPPSLLNSQVQDLEPLEADEDGITIDLSLPPEQIADQALAWTGTGR